MYQYKTIDLSYFNTAPIRLDDHVVIDRPPEKVFSVFEDNEAWATFDPGIKTATWTSEPPLHPGSTRKVVMVKWLRGTTVNEVFFVWQPNEQFAFYMHDGDTDKLVAYGELFTLEDLGNNQTRLRLQTAFEMSGKSREWFIRLIRPMLSWGYARMLKKVRAYVYEHTD